MRLALSELELSGGAPRAAQVERPSPLISSTASPCLHIRPAGPTPSSSNTTSSTPKALPASTRTITGDIAGGPNLAQRSYLDALLDGVVEIVCPPLPIISPPWVYSDLLGIGCEGAEAYDTEWESELVATDALAEGSIEYGWELSAMQFLEGLGKKAGELEGIDPEVEAVLEEHDHGMSFCRPTMEAAVLGTNVEAVTLVDGGVPGDEYPDEESVLDVQGLYHPPLILAEVVEVDHGGGDTSVELTFPIPSYPRRYACYPGSDSIPRRPSCRSGDPPLTAILRISTSERSWSSGVAHKEIVMVFTAYGETAYLSLCETSEELQGDDIGIPGLLGERKDRPVPSPEMSPWSAAPPDHRVLCGIQSQCACANWHAMSGDIQI